MRKGEARKQALLDTARYLFCQNGYEATAIDDILRCQKCSKGSFYHYFDSKLSLLSALSDEQAEKWFRAYQDMPVRSSLERLNNLLYCMHPFRTGEEEYLRALVGLRSRDAAYALEGALRDAERKLFKPEMERILMVLCETGAARISRERLQPMVFEAFTAFYDEMMLAIDRCREQPEKVYTLIPPVISSARFMWERLLDMSYGVLEIVHPDEALPILYRILSEPNETENTNGGIPQ